MKSSERHELKTDAFAETMAKGVTWAKAHQAQIAIAVVGVLVLIIGAGWLVATKQESQQNALELLNSAQRVSAQLAQETTPERKTAAVNDALKAYDQIIRDYPETDAAARSLLEAGEVLLTGRQADKAATYFQRCISQFARLPGLTALARRGLAAALEESGKPDQALEQYRFFANDPASPDAIEAYWDMGRCYEAMKDKDKATESYKKAVENGGDSKWAQLAQSRLAFMAMPVTPEVPPLLRPMAPLPTTTLPASPAVSAPATPAPSVTATTPAQHEVNRAAPANQEKMNVDAPKSDSPAITTTTAPAAKASDKP